MNLFIYSGKRYEPSNRNEKSLVFILSLTTTTRNPRNQLSNLHFSLHYAASAATSAAGSLYRPRVMSLRPQVPLPSPSTHRHPSWHTRTSPSRTPLPDWRAGQRNQLASRLYLKISIPFPKYWTSLTIIHAGMPPFLIQRGDNHTGCTLTTINAGFSAWK